MTPEKIENLLRDLAGETKEQAPAGLAEDIKSQIPQRLGAHRWGRDTINIIIDLRVSRLAAAAVILITVILSASLLGRGETASDNLLQESTLLIKYCLGGENATGSDVFAGLTKFYEHWKAQGKDVVYYGPRAALDSNDILLHWKESDDEYKVIFGDFHIKTVSSDELVKLQSEMLQKRLK